MEIFKNGKQTIYAFPNYTAVDNVNIIPLENGDIEISIDNGLTVTISGNIKHQPIITIDSGEYPAHLIIRQTESKWLSVLDNRVFGEDWDK